MAYTLMSLLYTVQHICSVKNCTASAASMPIKTISLWPFGNFLVDRWLFNFLIRDVLWGNAPKYILHFFQRVIRSLQIKVSQRLHSPRYTTKRKGGNVPLSKTTTNTQ